MKRIIFVYTLFIILIWSAPNANRFANIFGREIDINEEDVSGYIDSEGKFWVLARKWHTEKAIFGAPGGKMPLKYSDMRTIPYLYFLLYDRNGTKIKEGTLGDSVEGYHSILIPVKNGSALIISRIGTDIGIRMANPTSGYLSLILIDKNGVIKQKRSLLQPQFKDLFVHEFVLDYEGNIYLDLTSLYILSYMVKVHVDNGKILLEENVDRLQLPTTGRETYILEVLKNNIPFGCARVDTASWFKSFDKFSNKYYMDYKDYVLFKDKIEIPCYDIESQKWHIERYHLPVSSIRKFDDFDLYPLSSTPRVKDKPEFQSARLNNGNIVVTVLMKEDNKAVAYQMLFDSLGQYIAPEKLEILNPKDIKEIPDGNKIYIKRTLTYHDKSGKFKSANIYIWGYDKEDGVLYWKRYHVD